MDNKQKNPQNGGKGASEANVEFGTEMDAAQKNKNKNQDCK